MSKVTIFLGEERVKAVHPQQRAEEEGASLFSTELALQEKLREVV